MDQKLAAKVAAGTIALLAGSILAANAAGVTLQLPGGFWLGWSFGQPGPAQLLQDNGDDDSDSDGEVKQEPQEEWTVALMACFQPLATTLPPALPLPARGQSSCASAAAASLSSANEIADAIESVAWRLFGASEPADAEAGGSQALGTAAASGRHPSKASTMVPTGVFFPAGGRLMVPSWRRDLDGMPCFSQQEVEQLGNLHSLLQKLVGGVLLHGSGWRPDFRLYWDNNGTEEEMCFIDVGGPSGATVWFNAVADLPPPAHRYKAGSLARLEAGLAHRREREKHWFKAACRMVAVACGAEVADVVLVFATRFEDFRSA